MVIEHTTPVIRAPDLSYQDCDRCSEYRIARSTQIVHELQRALSKCSLSTNGNPGVITALLAAPNGKALV